MPRSRKELDWFSLQEVSVILTVVAAIAISFRPFRTDRRSPYRRRSFLFKSRNFTIGRFVHRALPIYAHFAPLLFYRVAALQEVYALRPATWAGSASAPVGIIPVICRRLSDASRINWICAGWSRSASLCTSVLLARPTFEPGMNFGASACNTCGFAVACFWRR